MTKNNYKPKLTEIVSGILKKTGKDLRKFGEEIKDFSEGLGMGFCYLAITPYITPIMVSLANDGPKPGIDPYAVGTCLNAPQGKPVVKMYVCYHWHPEYP